MAAIRRVSLKPRTKYWKFETLSLDHATAERQLNQWQGQGIDAIEIFAPARGGNSYDGLDAIHSYQLEADESLDDLRWVIRKAHDLGMPVIAFENLGYSSIYSHQFLKACDDIRASRNTRETRMFFWSKSGGAPAPASSNSYFFVRPSRPNHDASTTEFWQWDERCHSFYWTRWPGKDKDGNVIHLPQYNWADDAWPTEAERVVRFWMNVGFDGMVIDAVNWYVGYNWEKGNRSITQPIAGYGDTFSQPEGAGAFHTDDPVGWITEGHWTNLQDYGLGIWWEKDNHPLVESIEKGDPRIFETALRGYHDRVVAAGGTLYATVPQLHDEPRQTLAEALLATSGDLVCYCSFAGELTNPAPAISALLKMRRRHAALYQDSLRRQIPTQDDSRFYAILRSSHDRSERILVVFNFQSTQQTVKVDLGALDGHKFLDLSESAPVGHPGGSVLSESVPAYGFRLFLVR